MSISLWLSNRDAAFIIFTLEPIELIFKSEAFNDGTLTVRRLFSRLDLLCTDSLVVQSLFMEMAECESFD